MSDENHLTWRGSVVMGQWDSDGGSARHRICRVVDLDGREVFILQSDGWFPKIITTFREALTLADLRERDATTDRPTTDPTEAPR